MKHYALIAAILIALFAIACGGDDDDDDDGGSDATPTATATAAPTEAGDDDAAGDDDDAAGDDDDASGSGVEGGVAVVTIGDTTYEFDVAGALAACIPLGGALGAVGPAADGSGATVDLSLPPENWESLGADSGWEAPYIRLRDGDTDWRAGGDLVDDEIAAGRIPEGMSQVDSFSIDGGSASGTATFIDFRFGQSITESVTGSFEVSCG